ncbi:MULTISPECIES: hypothetical protein [unclassified Haladaptatus]|uniref:hypothetical protein n=1 Tax=unclassified Haladaptatus TaxID=2622732 RepID=UPI0023E817DE|nr:MULTISPECIES: hypothetical protein [unclassified Haladaptatus]
MLRRELLGAMGVVGLAGCLSSLRSSKGELAGIEVVNHDDVRHTVHLLVKLGGKLVHWSSHEVGGNDGTAAEANSTQLDREWPESSGLFTIYTRVDDAVEWEKLTLDTTRVGCHAVKILVDATEVKLWRTGCTDYPTAQPTSP